MVIGKILKKIVKIVNRIRLKNHGFTILCNSCIGGVIYSKLGEQFDSPTINMSMSDKEFLRFIHNMDYYLSFDLCPCKNDSHTQYNALIGDLHCFFGHYSSWNEVVEKWEKRKKRIHKDNLFIIMSDRPSGGIETEITHEDMLSLKRVKCAGKMIFSTKKYSDIDYIIHLPKDEEGDYVNSYMYDKIPFLGLWRWELRFDYVKWLNKSM